MPIVQSESSQNQWVQENAEESLDLRIVKEPLLVEVGYGSLHIEFTQSPNEN